MKNNKGISLIALVITIIVLLILEGITISIINGNEDTAKRAKEAKDITDSSNELENIKIAVLQAEEKSFDGTVTATNLKNALNGVVSQEEINKITGNGPWIVKKNDRDYKIEDNGDVVEYTKADKINSKIGQAITYPTLGGATSWKIFYAESNEMFIIPTNIISRTNASAKDSLSNGIPLSTKTVAEVMGSGTYGGKWNSTWLNTPKVVTTEARHQAVTYLCDPENWEAYVAKTTGTNPTKLIANSYAVGAPTLELFVASWNKAVNSSKIVSTPLNTTAYGYDISINSEITTNEANALYNPNGSGNYWIASPHGYNANGNIVYILRCTNKDLNNFGYSNALDFRPIVSIPINNVQIAEGTGAVSIVDDNGNAIQ